jgi:hypothetical protein
MKPGLFYVQSTGQVWSNGALLGVGYSGFGEGKNNPALERVKGIGPTPLGRYQLEPPGPHPTAGGFVMRLSPLPGTQTFGRSGFLVHGDNVDPDKRGTASHGCIVLARAIREAMWASGVRTLEVVADAPATAPEGASTP